MSDGAGSSFTPRSIRKPLNRQNEETLLWKRYPGGADVGHGHRHVVHGHHANSQAPIAGKHKTDLDGLAWKTGRLVVEVFDDDRPGGAAEYLEVIGNVDFSPSWAVEMRARPTSPRQAYRFPTSNKCLPALQIKV